MTANITVDSMTVAVGGTKHLPMLVEYAPAYGPILTAVISACVLIFIALRQTGIARTQMFTSVVSPLREKWIHKLRDTVANFLLSAARSDELGFNIEKYENRLKDIEQSYIKSGAGSGKKLDDDVDYIELRKEILVFEKERRDSMFAAKRDLLIIDMMLSNISGDALHKDLHDRIKSLLASPIAKTKEEQAAYHEREREITEAAKKIFKAEWERIKKDSKYEGMGFFPKKRA